MSLRRAISCTIAVFAVFGLVACSGSQTQEEPVVADADKGTSEAEDAAAATPPDAADAAPASEPAPAASAPTVQATFEPGRVVRYISATEAAIHSAPQSGAEAVGKLLKGDKVLIVEENGWGRIADGMYIKLDGLSSKAIPSDRQPAAWIAPTH